MPRQLTAPPRLKRDIHGEYSCYTTAKCRCTKCTAASTRYAKQRELLKNQDQWQPWTDATPVRRHLANLQAAGLGRDTIGVLAGVASSTVDKLIRNGNPRVRTRVAQKILAVQLTLDVLPDWVKTDSTGTRRRLQALMVAGWSAQALAARLGMDRALVRKITNADKVRASTARAVRDLFAAMWDQAPPVEDRYERASVNRTRRYAADQGWAPAVAWDDIDDPKCKPRGVRAVAS